MLRASGFLTAAVTSWRRETESLLFLHYRFCRVKTLRKGGTTVFSLPDED
jgi:hypothetical protein